MNITDILHFFFEIGNLRRIKHEGWRVTGVEDPESVADHSLRAAQIGYILAEMEEYENPMEICTMLVFHDIGECRIGDIHKIANRYIENTNEDKAVKDQLSPLKNTGNKLFSLWKQVEMKHSQAGIIAKDSDLLEQALTAKEYLEKGYKAAIGWIENIEKLIQTNSAKKILEQLDSMNSYDWFQGIKKIP